MTFIQTFNTNFVAKVVFYKSLTSIKIYYKSNEHFIAV